MKHPLMLLSVTAGLLLLCAPESAGQDSYTLTYRFQPGTTYLYADTSRATQIQEMMGQEMKITSFLTMRTRIAGEQRLEDGTMTFVTSFDSFKVATKSPMNDTTMVMEDLLGKRTRMTLAAGGALIRREIVDTIKQSRMMMRGISMREAARFHRMSAEPVGVGSSWKTDVVDSTDMMNGKLISHHAMTYTVTGKTVCEGRACLQIGYTGDVTLEGKGSMRGVELFMEGKGKTSGTLDFDHHDGLIVQDESGSDTEMTAALTGGENVTIPMSQSITTTRRLFSVEGSDK